MGHPTYMGETRNYLKMLFNSPNRERSGERQKQMREIYVREICFEDDKLILVDQELVQWHDFCNGSMKFRFPCFFVHFHSNRVLRERSRFQIF